MTSFNPFRLSLSLKYTHSHRPSCSKFQTKKSFVNTSPLQTLHMRIYIGNPYLVRPCRNPALYYVSLYSRITLLFPWKIFPLAQVTSSASRPSFCLSLLPFLFAVSLLSLCIQVSDLCYTLHELYAFFPFTSLFVVHAASCYPQKFTDFLHADLSKKLLLTII